MASKFKKYMGLPGKSMGNSDDLRCKQGTYQRIDKRTCKNGCKYYKGVWNPITKKYKRRCSIGFDNNE